MALLTKIFGDANAKYLQRLKQETALFNELEPAVSRLSAEELKAKTAYFREQLKQGKGLDDIAKEAFAVVREAAKRTLNMRHFDVQLIGGLVLHSGQVAEMKTGEGKTLVATLALYLNALEGKGAHLVTVNDYLAKRDASWMGQIFDALGLSIGVIIPDESYIFDREYENKGHFDERMKHLR